MASNRTPGARGRHRTPPGAPKARKGPARESDLETIIRENLGRKTLAEYRRAMRKPVEIPTDPEEARRALLALLDEYEASLDGMIAESEARKARAEAGARALVARIDPARPDTRKPARRRPRRAPRRP